MCAAGYLLPLVPVLRLGVIRVIDLLRGVDRGGEVLQQGARVHLLLVNEHAVRVVGPHYQRVQMRLLVLVDIFQTLTE